MTDQPAALPDELVQEFVGVAHGQFDRVVELLARTPSLVNAVWDWGGGDFESALGAAAHMGRRDIALHLLANGARFDLYAAAMLGQLDLVRAVLAAEPQLRNVPGAHGIPLLVHAQMGGPEAQAVVDWLQAEAAAA
jgi:hypothetical protein